MFLRRACRVLTVGLLAATLVSLPLIESPAGAQTAAEKRAEAERVADELEQLRIRASQLDEEYAQRLMELEEVQQAIIDAEERVAGLQEEYDRTRAELDSYAVAAYIGGDDVPTTETLLQSEAPNEVGTKVAYLTAASGDRQELLDQVEGARVTLDAELSDLHESEQEAERLTSEAEAARDGAQESVAEEEAVLAEVEGELADLLAAEEAARAAEAQRRAEAEAREQAAQADQAPPPEAPSNDEIDRTNEAPGEPPPTVPSPSPGGPPAGAAEAVSLAWSLIGIPYVWGGSSPSSGFDCSGFTSYVWGQAGYSLPHSAAAQAAMTIPVPYSELQPGDLVFYGWGYIHHVALYVGGGQIVHAPGRGRSVRVDSVYYWDQMHGAGRLP